MNKPMKFRKKPVVIEAMHVEDGVTPESDVYKWVKSTAGEFDLLPVIQNETPPPPSGVAIDPRDGRLVVSTLEGVKWAEFGDWIIKGVQEEFYPIKPEIFEETYEEA